jgi:hypothetical protein
MRRQLDSYGLSVTTLGPQLASCGQNYSIDSDESLAQLSGFHRDLRFVSPKGKYAEGRYLEPDEKMPKKWVASRRWTEGNGLTLEQFCARADVFVEATALEEMAGEEKK